MPLLHLPQGRHDVPDHACVSAQVGYIVSGPVVCMVWEGKGVVASARKLIGATNPLASEPGTIRGDFAIEVGRNVIHGSDSPENGERETGEQSFTTGWMDWLKSLTHRFSRSHLVRR
jgi:nucleoside-diphosphate kinase